MSVTSYFSVVSKFCGCLLAQTVCQLVYNMLNNRIMKVMWLQDLLSLSSYRSHVIDQAFRPGLM